MSTQFLALLDNGRSVYYTAFVSGLTHHARIAWYPSAGTDFRPLFYLNNAFLLNNPPVNGEDPIEPDIFLFTDYGLYNEIFEKILFDGADPIVHDDGRSKVTLSDIADFGQIDFDSYPDYQLTEKNAHFFNRVFFFNVTIESSEFGSITKPVLYAFCCNEQICSELTHYYDNEYRIISYYGVVIPQEPISIVKTIREIDGRGWSESTRILWQQVRRNPELFPRYKPDGEMRFHRLEHMFRRMNNSNLYNIYV